MGRGRRPDAVNHLFLGRMLPVAQNVPCYGPRARVRLREATRNAERLTDAHATAQ